MKKKIVIGVTMNGHKSRSKALKIVVGVQGVESVALQGQDKDLIEVIGYGVDPVKLISLLRKDVGWAAVLRWLTSLLKGKTMGSAHIVSVAPVEEEKGSGDDKTIETPVQFQPPLYWHPCGAPYYVY